MASTPMISIPEKRPSALDLYHPLRQQIASTFSEPDAVAAEPDLAAVQRMRSNLEKPPPDRSLSSLNSRLDLLLSYHRALSVMKSRLTIPFSLSFSWHDAFKASKKAVQKSVELERAAVVFNIGAIHSQIGVMLDRASEEGRKQACGEFQKAAGAFALLKQMVSAGKIEGATVDLTGESVGMLERFMLAQAQECFFEKVTLDCKPASLCSKVAKQACLYYEEAYTALNASPLNQHFDKAWVSHIQLKSALFFAHSCYFYSIQLHEKEQIGEEIARLKIGINALTESRRIAKGASPSLLESASLLASNMNQNLEKANRDNDLIYLLQIPLPNSLPPLATANLVKPIPVAEALDFSKETLFSSLVPEITMKALATYSEMVDDVIRKQSESIQQASEIARVRLNEMVPPGSILEGSLSLPMDLKEEVKAIHVRGGPAGLEIELQQLRDLRSVNLGLMSQIEETLLKEAGEDSLFRAQFGERWTRPESGVLTKSLKEQLSRFGENLAQAGVSDAHIEQVVQDNYAVMAILDSRPIESALPKPRASFDHNGDEIVQALNHSMSQLENLGAECASLEDMLKEAKAKDDILPKLMMHTGLQEALFKNEIGKYDKTCEDIAQNIRAQGILLLQIQTLNDKLVAALNLEEYKGECEKSYEQIRIAIAKFREIKENISDGIKFYVTLQDSLKNLNQQSSDFVLTRNMQSQEMVEILTSQNSYTGWRGPFSRNS